MANPPAKRVDVTVPACRDAIQRILDNPDILELHIGKPKSADFPVEVGIVRRSTLKATWWYGGSLFQALERAESGIRGRTLLEDV